MNFQKDFIQNLTETNVIDVEAPNSLRSRNKKVFITLLVVKTFAAVLGASYITQAITISEIHPDNPITVSKL